LIEDDRDEGLHVDDGSSLCPEGLMGTLVLVEGSGAKSSLLSPTGRVGLDCETTGFGLLGSSCGGVIIIGHQRRAGGHATRPRPVTESQRGWASSCGWIGPASALGDETARGGRSDREELASRPTTAPGDKVSNGTGDLVNGR
jgi:hypothetical protein